MSDNMDRVKSHRALMAKRIEMVKTPENRFCSICASEMEPDEEEAFPSGCAHVFCIPCIKRWTLEKATCPLCKEPYTKVICNIRSKTEVFAMNVTAIREAAVGEFIEVLLNGFIGGVRNPLALVPNMLRRDVVIRIHNVLWDMLESSWGFENARRQARLSAGIFQTEQRQARFSAGIIPMEQRQARFSAGIFPMEQRQVRFSAGIFPTEQRNEIQLLERPRARNAVFISATSQGLRIDTENNRVAVFVDYGFAGLRGMTGIENVSIRSPPLALLNLASAAVRNLAGGLGTTRITTQSTSSMQTVEQGTAAAAANNKEPGSSLAVQPTGLAANAALGNTPLTIQVGEIRRRFRAPMDELSVTVEYITGANRGLPETVSSTTSATEPETNGAEINGRASRPRSNASEVKIFELDAGEEK